MIGDLRFANAVDRVDISLNGVVADLADVYAACAVGLAAFGNVFPVDVFRTVDLPGAEIVTGRTECVKIGPVARVIVSPENIGLAFRYDQSTRLVDVRIDEMADDTRRLESGAVIFLFGA